jgi:putative ABC transport system permease protein
MDTLRHDVRHAFRMFAAQRAVTIAAVVTLALGIGATAAVFSVAYGVLTRPLPYAEPDRLVRLSETHPGGGSPLTAALLSDLTVEAWRPRMRSMEDVAVYSERTVTVGRENPERLAAAAVSPSLFGLLRVAPVAGRFFDSGEDEAGRAHVVVLSHAFWRERYGARASVLGESVVIDGRPHQIVGIAPPAFAFPSRDARFWTPYVLPRYDASSAGGMRVLSAVGRLRPGVTVQQAADEGTAAARSVQRPMVADLLFGKGGPVEVRARTLVDDMTAAIRPALLVLSTAVALVLLIACANVANLFLARAVTRQRELAVRSALGAGRGRLARQLLTESVILAAIGGALGVAGAWTVITMLPRLAPQDFPRLDAVRLDGAVLGFAALISMITGVLSGVVPALRGARTGLSGTLRDADARTVTSRSRVRSGLLVTEAALALVLLVSAGLLLRSFDVLLRVDPGYDIENVLAAQVVLPDDENAETRTAAFLDAVLDSIRRMPNVVAAGASNMAPFGNATAITGHQLPGAGSDGQPVVARANSWVVTPGFAEAMGLRLVEGRHFTQVDVGASMQAMLVNEEFARLYLADGRPVVGRRFEKVWAREGTTEIVGIVRNVLKDGLDRTPQPEIYVTPGMGFRIVRQPSLLVRTAGDPSAVANDLRRIVREIDATAALDSVGSLAGRVADSVAQQRFAMLVFVMFAALALALAAVGLYGVLSYGVSQRRKELGVRAALGASGSHLLALVLRDGLAVTALGLMAGLLIAAALTRLMTGLLFGVSPTDAVVFVLAPAVLLVVALAACVVPARRAASTDPAEVLRSE